MMTKDQIKKFIAERVAQGISLSKIQDELQAEHQVKMTFLELRMLASEIQNADWSKLDKPEPKKEDASAPAGEPAEPESDAELPPEEGVDALEDDLDKAEKPAAKPAADGKMRGKTKVEVSKVAMPGAALNGSVTFGSGVTADWYLDQMGRIGLDKVKGGKPDETDVTEFQDELSKLLGA